MITYLLLLQTAYGTVVLGAYPSLKTCQEHIEEGEQQSCELKKEIK